MINSFHHKGLRRLYENNDQSGLPSGLAERIATILASLDQAIRIEDVNRPSFRLRSLKGELWGFHAINVRANWRIIFRFAESGAHDVDLLDNI
jgi:proteic killer suppression protein